MKYLKVFEKFESKNLSKVFGYISKDSRIKFIQDLKIICENNDYPMSEISDDKFRYLRFTEAFNLKDEGQDKNIKFWFSLEGKYIGITKFIPISDTSDINKYDIDFSKNFSHGHEYRKLDHLQKVLININGINGIATIWNYAEKVYAIQNFATGNTPERKGDYRDWSIYGNKCWILGGYDYGHIYKASKKDISKIVEDEGQDKRSPEQFNGSCDIHLIRTKQPIKEFLKDAAFALILNYNLLKNHPKSVLSKIRDDRNISKNVLSKKDAEIRKENLDRYLPKLLKYDSSLGINQFKKIVLRIYGLDHPIYFVWTGTNNYIFLSTISYMYDLIKRHRDSADHKASYAEELSNYIESSSIAISEKYSNVRKNIDLCKKKAKEEKNESKMKFLEKYDELNKAIKSIISRGSMETIADLDLSYNKIQMISSMIKESIYRFGTQLGSFFDHLGSDRLDVYKYIDVNDQILDELDEIITSLRNF